MATITAAAGGGSWTTGATWVGGVAPTAADDAKLDATSGNVTVSSGAVCRSLDCTGYTGTLTHTSAVTLTVGDATAGAGSVALKLVAGMTYTAAAATCAISFVSTSTTQQTVDYASKTCGNQTYNGAGGSWLWAGNFTCSGAVTVTAGTLDMGGRTVSAATFASSGSATRAVTMGSTALTLTAIGTTVWNTATTTGLTFNAGTSTITVTGAGVTFDSATLTFATAAFTGSNTTVLPANACTFTNLTRTGAATKDSLVSVRANYTITGTLTLGGNSAVNRLQVQSNTAGTARTLTAATVTASNVDLQDITAAGAGSWNLSAITGNSGDCGGNTGITFTTAATQTWSGTSGGNWSANAWTSRVPLPQDDVVISAAFSASQTVTADMPRLGKSVDWTGATGSPTFANSVATTSFGSLTLISGMTVTLSSGHTVAGRSSYTLTSAGRTFTGAVTVSAPTGTYTLQDALATSGALNVLAGTLTTGSQTITCTNMQVNGSTATGNLGASTINLTGTTSGINIFLRTGGGTITAGAATFNITTATANTRNFAPTTGTSQATLNYTVASSTGILGFSGALDLAALNVGSGRTLQFASGSTYTIRSASLLGAAGALLSIVSATPGSQATLSKPSGVVDADYLSVKDIAATGGASWYAGANSTNVSNNTGWFFTPAATGRFLAIA